MEKFVNYVLINQLNDNFHCHSYFVEGNFLYIQATFYMVCLIHLLDNSVFF